jgi:hypothetical protein
MKFLNPKKFIVLCAFSLFVLNNTYAQEKSNPWVFGIGANAIDYFPGNAPNTGNDNGFLNEIFNSREHWNISAPQIMVTRYLIDNLSADGLISFNSITKYGNYTIDKESYFAFDVNLRYSFIDTSKDFTIFALVGGGYTFALDTSGGTFNLGGGMNYWFNDVVGLNLEAFYKHNSDDFQLAPHFYYALNVVFRLNFNRNPRYLWRNGM